MRRFSVAEYHELLRLGILQSGDPVELIEGILVTKATKSPREAVAIGLIHDELFRVIPMGWFIRSQDPLTTDDSEPEPDQMIVSGGPRDYSQHHPAPADVAVTIEVSEDSLSRDRGLKKRLYARAKLPVYWIVNLIERQVEVYTDPTGPADLPEYRKKRIFSENDFVPLEIEGREFGHILVASLLP